MGCFLRLMMSPPARTLLVEEIVQTGLGKEVWKDPRYPAGKNMIRLKRPSFSVTQIPEDKKDHDFLPYETYYLRPTAQFYDNALITAIHFAHAQHRPLILSPDMVWFTLAQGFALHLHQHPDFC